MSKGVLNYVGMKYDARSQMEKPHFLKKDGSGEWGLAPGPVDFSKFQPGKLFVVWDNWTVQSATTEIPSGGGGAKGGSWKAQPYHPETFVSNVVGQAIQAGLIKAPADLPAWVSSAWAQIRSIQEPAIPPAPVANQPPVVDEDGIPF